MNGLDVVIIVVAAAAAVGGFRMGFVARVLSWAGLGLGLYIGARIVPHIARQVQGDTPGARLLIAVAVLVGPGLIGLALGLGLGASLSRLVAFGPLRLADKAVGAVVGVVGVLAVLWLLLPALASVSGLPARATAGSVITRALSSSLPQPPNTLLRLRNLVGDVTGPLVFNGLHQSTAVGPPPAAVPLSAATVAEVSASTVKVTGQACNQIQDGSGFTVAPHLIATNAHVVAGEPSGQTSVILPSGAQEPATVVLYDPNRDLALLSVPGDGEAPLTLAKGAVNDVGAVFGHPGGQAALAVTPAKVSQEVTAVGQDLYDTHSTQRDVYILASSLMPGDSGGALVVGSGQVIGVAFAIAPDSPGTSYALAADELQQVLAEPHSSRVSTEACLAG